MKSSLISLRFFLFFVLIAWSFRGNAQKILNESETQWVLEAKFNLEKAYSDPSLPEQERLQMIARSARTLKEYGQPPMPLTGESPLRQFMENNYQKKMEECISANSLINELNKGLLKQKMRLVNDIQIDVASEQIKFVIPGSTTVSLSKDLVNTLFDCDIGGANGGQVANAKDLKNKFLALVKAQKNIGNLEAIKKVEMESAANLDKDRKNIVGLEDKMRQTYNNAEAGTSTFEGYKNSVLNEKKNPKQVISPLVGTWIFTAPGFNVSHRYNMDGTCFIRVNRKQNDYKYEISDNQIIYLYPDGKTSTMGFLIEGNQLFYTSKKGKKEGHPLTRQ